MRRALVTGSAAGLGRALVETLLGDGWQVCGVDRDEAERTERYVHYRADLSDPDAVDDLLNRIDGRFDLVVLNAGISATGRFEVIPAEVHARLLAVNAEAPLVLADGLMGKGQLDPSSRIVIIASLSVDVGYPGAASYAASKDALAGYARSIRRRKGSPSVTLVLPGPIRTEHAARHAPANSSDASRMPPELLARQIVRVARRGARTLRPGVAASAAGLLGRLAPGLTARAMRRALFEKLDREVW